MLTPEMRRHVETNWKRVREGQLKVYRSRLRRQVIEALLDLALVAEREPEDQLKQVFTPETVGILIQALTGHGCETIQVRHHEIARLMLDAAYQRLQILLDPDYRTMVLEPLNKGVKLLTVIPIPKEPRKTHVDTVNHQREKTKLQRQRIRQEHKLLPEKRD